LVTIVELFCPSSKSVLTLRRVPAVNRLHEQQLRLTLINGSAELLALIHLYNCRMEELLLQSTVKGVKCPPNVGIDVDV